MIRKNALYKILACLLLVLFSVVTCKADTKEPVILILNSYHQGFDWSDEELAGEIEVLYKAYPNASIYMEHMDQKRFPGILNTWQLNDQILRKFSNKAPDIIIANDNIATKYALFLKESSWPNIPIVFTGFSGREDLPSPLPEEVTGIIEHFDVEENIKMFRQLYPDLQNLFIVSENSETGNSILKGMREQLESTNDISIIYLQDESLDEIREIVQEIPQNSVVLLLPYSRLSNGEFVGNKMTGRLIVEASSVPVYVSYDVFLGTGVIGGHVLSGRKQGNIAAEMVVETLRTGKVPPILSKAPTVPTFDYKALKKFGINLNNIPEDSVLINSPDPSFYIRNASTINITLAAISLIIISTLCLVTYYRKKYAQELQEIFDSIEESLLIIDAEELNIIKYNPASLRLLGYKGDESIDLTPEDFWLEEAPYNKRYALRWFDKTKRGESQMVSWKIKRKDGEFRWVEAGLQYTTLARKKCFVIVMRDVDDRYTMSLQLQEYRDRLQDMVDSKTTDLQASQKELELLKDSAIAANNAKSEFIATMSHEMRTPLTGVIGLMQVLERTALNSEQSNFVSRALTAGRQLLATINDILDFAKMESGEIKIIDQPFTLQKVLLAAQDSVFINPDQNLTLVENVADDVPRHLIGDQFRLGQILINLLGNAAKFTEKGQVTLEVSVVNTSQDTTTLRFNVRDTGPGIPHEIQSRLFEAFFQVDSKTTHRRGTGLGLNICHKLVTAMGGEIGVRDNEGGGSCFWFELNFLQGQEDTKSMETAEAKTAPATGRQHIYSGKKFLLVEDNEINMYMIKTLLLSGGAEVFLARNGQEGLDLLEEQEVDVVIMDVQMPVMDGHEATRQIRKDPQYDSLPVIAMTANIFANDVDECFQAGMNGHLAKPFTVTELDEILLNALEKQGQ